MTDASDWETHAGWWQREFTDGADPEYEEQILPWSSGTSPAPRRVLDIGAVRARSPAGRRRSGADVVGRRPDRGQITVARERGGGPALRAGRRRAPAGPRPAPFDAVVMCLVIEHLDPFEPAIHEMARVLGPAAAACSS